MTPDQPLPILATHGGKFHCDEVFAYAVLRLALGLREAGQDHVLRRTRKPELLETADIVWDVGFVFDEAANRFDHHQRGAPLRPDGTPYSSAGLVWRGHGERAVASLLKMSGSERFAPAIAAELDESLVRWIDENDNGVAAAGPVRRDHLDLASLVGDFNPSWDDPAGQGSPGSDVAFLEAAELVAGVLCRRVDGLRARLAAEADVLAAYRAAEDPRILVLERGMPWKNVVFSHDLPVLFTVSPASNGQWMLDAVPPEPGSFAQRLPLPEAWAGLESAALAETTGVADAVFVHLRRFVAAAKSRDGAVEMARRAMAA
ncbi:MYG1 family protein [Roseococcus sp. SYP-B2431]|uniref:MYG1 family protein n=1 Tax=Roseococcus sp. SYP-B2431 TaxID=2496640 RepID=UPI00103C68B9|nr:MYG1 family protein [Roseococcus sp. SYP-B2431]TCH97926.1 MYG1 family protein [Roseococcus sp. SYP-B2431]